MASRIFQAQDRAIDDFTERQFSSYYLHPDGPIAVETLRAAFHDDTRLILVALVNDGAPTTRSARRLPLRATFACILAEGGIAGAESSIASVAEIFTLQGRV